MPRIKKIKPLFNKILTTCNLYEENVETDGIIDSTKSAGSICELQTVLAVGPFVKCVKVGDVVCINPTRYQVMKHQEGSLKDGVITDNMVVSYNFPILPINGEPCLYIYDSDVDFIVKEWEDDLVTLKAADIDDTVPEIV